MGDLREETALSSTWLLPFESRHHGIQLLVAFVASNGSRRLQSNDSSSSSSSNSNREREAVHELQDLENFLGIKNTAINKPAAPDEPDW